MDYPKRSRAYAKMGTEKSKVPKCGRSAAMWSAQEFTNLNAEFLLKRCLKIAQAEFAVEKIKGRYSGRISAPIVTAEEAQSMTLDYESVASKGSMLGSGGMIILDESRDVVQVLKNLAEFYHDESCGQCTPCREGTVGLKKSAQLYRKRSSQEDIKLLDEISLNMMGRTICVLADSIAMPVQVISRNFPKILNAI